MGPVSIDALTKGAEVSRQLSSKNTNTTIRFGFNRMCLVSGIYCKNFVTQNYQKKARGNVIILINTAEDFLNQHYRVSIIFVKTGNIKSGMKTYKRIAISAYFFLVGVLYYYPLLAQERRKFSDETPFIAKKYFSISALPLIVASKASIKGDTKKYSLTSAPQLSFEALVNYHYDFERNYSLIFGIGGGVIGHNFDYVIPKEMFDPPTNSDITSNTAASREKELFYIKFPLELERKWVTYSGRLWNANVGISLLFSPQKDIKTGHTFIYPNGQMQDFLEINQNNNNHGKPWLNYHIAAGHTWFFSKKNSIRTNLKLNLSFTEFGSATYQFFFPNQPILEGQYSVTGSYIGLSLSYIFSGPNN